MPQRANLDLDTLRTFSTAGDLGSLAKAADRLGRTASAISLQMKRLQEDLGTPLFRKSGRGLALTEAGETVLKYARRMLAVHDELLDAMDGANLAGRISVGCAQDFAAYLPSVLSQFSAMYPNVLLEVRVEGNSSLVSEVEKGQLDLAVVIGHDDNAAAKRIGEIEVVWIASSGFAPRTRGPLPLAVLGPKCAFRKCAMLQLEAAGIPFRISATSIGLDGLWAALIGNVGVTARTAFNLPDGLKAATSLYGLPVLGSLPVTLLRSRSAEGVAADRMASLISETVQSALRSQKQG